MHPVPSSESETASARLIARTWIDAMTALVNGDPAASAFADWLAGFWEPALDRPDNAPDVRGPHASSGLGIDWFERDGWVSGHIAGQRGGYLVPRAAILEQACTSGAAEAA